MGETGKKGGGNKPPVVEGKPLLDILQHEAPEILRGIPAKERGKLQKRIVQMSYYRCGPLPDPSELAAYSQIIDDGANRIMKMAEAQSHHRIEMEKLVIGQQQKLAARGQIFAFILGVLGMGLGGWMVHLGNPGFAVVFFGGTLVSLVVAFLTSKSDQKKDLANKRPPVST